MPQQGYSIGRDVTLAVILSTGGTLRLGKVTNFKSKTDEAEQKIPALDGDTDHLRFHQGWSGSFTMERRGPEVDTYFAQLEANYYAGLAEPPVTIQQTILEPSGAVSQYRYEKTVLKLDDAGDWSADKSVVQNLSFMAARRIKQA